MKGLMRTVALCLVLITRAGAYSEAPNVRTSHTSRPVHFQPGGRRKVLASIVVSTLTFGAKGQSHALNNPSTELDAEWKDADFGFFYPNIWTQSSKPLQTHQKEVNLNSGIRGYYAGVVVDPVKLDSLETFGTPKFVGDRVVAVERKKDGVFVAELVRATRVALSGEVYYDLEYTNESSHGNNHYLSRIAVRAGKLYVLTVQCKAVDFEKFGNEMALIASTFGLSAEQKQAAAQ